MSRSQRWAAATAVVVVLVFAVGWLALISPQRSRTASLHSQADSTNQQVMSLDTQISRLQKEAGDVVQQKARIQEIATEIPSAPNLASYIRSLTSKASDTGVDLVSIAPAAPVAATVTAVKPAARATASASPSPSAGATTAPTPRTPVAPQSNLSVITMQLQVAGDYWQIQRFLNELQDLKRVTVVSALALSPGGHRTQAQTANVDPADSWRTLNGSVTLAIFMTDAPLATASAPAPSPSPSH